MTQEIKNKLEQAAKAEIDSSVWSNHDDSLPLNVSKNALVRFAQTILDNPGEWGLYPPDPAQVVLANGYHRLQSENELLRDTLENRIKELEESIKVMKFAIQFTQNEVYSKLKNVKK